jgi:hypothetical protein
MLPRLGAMTLASVAMVENIKNAVANIYSIVAASFFKDQRSI